MRGRENLLVLRKNLCIWTLKRFHLFSVKKVFVPVRMFEILVCNMCYCVTVLVVFQLSYDKNTKQGLIYGLSDVWWGPQSWEPFLPFLHPADSALNVFLDKYLLSTSPTSKSSVVLPGTHPTQVWPSSSWSCWCWWRWWWRCSWWWWLVVVEERTDNPGQTLSTLLVIDWYLGQWAAWQLSHFLLVLHKTKLAALCGDYSENVR